MLISIETHITCDFPGGIRIPYPPLDPHLRVKHYIIQVRFEFRGHLQTFV